VISVAVVRRRLNVTLRTTFRGPSDPFPNERTIRTQTIGQRRAGSARTTRRRRTKRREAVVVVVDVDVDAAAGSNRPVSSLLGAPSPRPVDENKKRKRKRRRGQKRSSSSPPACRSPGSPPRRADGAGRKGEDHRRARASLSRRRPGKKEAAGASLVGKSEKAGAEQRRKERESPRSSAPLLRVLVATKELSSWVVEFSF
jgi:hypothetical protein